MKPLKILKEIKILETEYKNLNKEFKNHKILKSNLNKYLKEDKDSFKILWLKYIDFFSRLQKLIKLSKYRRFYFFVNYHKLILRKYVLVFYFNSIIDIEKIFWKHEEFIRVFLWENFKKNYEHFAKYIYRPNFINIINTPNIFIKAFTKFIKPSLYKILDSKKLDIKNNNRLKTDRKNLFFYIKHRVDKILFIISKNVWYIISKTKFTTRKKWLITDKNIDIYLKIAKPWDIFLTRWNWNASNLSIPGFWKHMSMYLWKWSFLKENFDYKFINKLDNKTHYIIEATWKWIEIVELKHLSSTNDYLWVSRTKFKKDKIFRVLNNSFKHIWKWYDHRFDYYSDSSLVCTELIMKSYTKEFVWDVGIDIKLENIWVSLTYPPNNFVDLLVDWKEGVEPIFFIDSFEKKWENFISTTDKFLKSRKRSRFSLFLK